MQRLVLLIYSRYVLFILPKTFIWDEFLQDFPILSKLDPAVYGSPESAITKECLEHELNGMSLEEV